MNNLSRRQFAQLLVSGLAATLVARCAPRPAAPATPTPGEPVLTPTPVVPAGTSTLAAATSTPGRILRNENVKDFYVRYYKGFPAPDPAQWRLSVEGLVKNPQTMTVADVQSLARVSQVSRMKCVECWSAAARWEGFHLRALAERVEPLPTAEWLQFYCADGYFESLSLAKLMEERSLFVYRMNDQPLPDKYGAPLRLIVPSLYGYKGAKAITRLVFADKELRGYWSTVGPYTPDGHIEPGRDHPLDLGESRPITGGEVKYPDGIESK